MSIEIREHVLLAPYATFRMGGAVSHFVSIREPEELREAFLFARREQLPVFVLGGGSNTVFTHTSERRLLVIHMANQTIHIGEETPQGEIVVTAGAGVIWDHLVEETVQRGYSGIELLSAIPGTVGATPVQNVGAYGREIKDVFVSLEAYDRETDTFVTLEKEACQFGYRDSLFKHSGKDRYVITSVTYRLRTTPPTIPDYPGVKQYFGKEGITDPTVSDIRQAICTIRSKKLPDPKDIASVGSFFKNPIVPDALAEKIRTTYPEAVIFSVGSGFSKIGAGWMIDTLGLKGKEFGNLMLYPNNALVIVNKGGATFEELQKVVSHIQSLVLETFGVQIEPEPDFI